MNELPLGTLQTFQRQQYLLYGRAKTEIGVNRHRANLRNVGEKEGREFRVTKIEGVYYVWRKLGLGPLRAKKHDRSSS